jgi:hypothetical protein
MKIEVEKTERTTVNADPMDGILLYFYTGRDHREDSPEVYAHVLGANDCSDYGLPYALGPGDGNDRKWWSFGGRGSSRPNVEEEVADFLGLLYAARLKEKNFLTRAVPDATLDRNRSRWMIHLGLGDSDRRGTGEAGPPHP